MPVGVMLRSMTSAEIVEWAAWFDIRAYEMKKGRSAGNLYD